MAFRWAMSNPPSMGFCRSSYTRAAVLRASKAANCFASRRSGTFLRTSVPGYTYGSESSLIPLIYRGPELFEADLAIDVSLEDTRRFVIQVQVFDAKVSDGSNESLLPLYSFSLADWSCGCCHCSNPSTSVILAGPASLSALPCGCLTVLGAVGRDTPQTRDSHRSEERRVGKERRS